MEGLRVHLNLSAAAGWTARLHLLAAAAAVGARLRENHVPASRRHRAAAMTVQAAALGASLPAGPLTRSAQVVTRDRHLMVSAPHRFFERQRQRLMQVGAA